MCIFCKIVDKEMPCYCIYEDKEVMAFLDISQVTKGHVLLIPKQHYDDFIECDDELLMHMAQIAKMLAKRIMARTDAEGMNIISNIHEVAGQSVQHFHIHLIPRYGDDDACVVRFDKSPKQDMDALKKLLM